MLKSIKPRVLWNVMKTNERVLYVLPPVYDITNDYIQGYFIQTIQGILESNPKYVVLYVEDNTQFSDDMLRRYEEFFQTEIQWLMDLHYLTDPTFMEHHYKTKTYLYYKPYELDTSFFDITINDNMKTKFPAELGKLLIEEVVNRELYLNKLYVRLEQLPLGRFQPQHQQTYDIGFVIGNDVNVDKMKNILTKYIDQNQCSFIYCIEPELSKYIKTLKFAKIPLILAKQPKPNGIINTIKKVSLKYTTVVCIGKINLNSDDWDKYAIEITKHALFDPYALDTMVSKTAQQELRIATQPYSLLDAFISNEADF